MSIYRGDEPNPAAPQPSSDMELMLLACNLMMAHMMTNVTVPQNLKEAAMEVSKKLTKRIQAYQEVRGA